MLNHFLGHIGRVVLRGGNRSMLKESIIDSRRNFAIISHTPGGAILPDSAFIAGNDLTEVIIFMPEKFLVCFEMKFFQVVHTMDSYYRNCSTICSIVKDLIYCTSIIRTTGILCIPLISSSTTHPPAHPYRQKLVNRFLISRAGPLSSIDTERMP